MFKSYEFLLSEAHKSSRSENLQLVAQFQLTFPEFDDSKSTQSKSVAEETEACVKEIELKLPKSWRDDEELPKFELVICSETGVHLFDSSGIVMQSICETETPNKIRPSVMACFTNSQLVFDSQSEEFLIVQMNHSKCRSSVFDTSQSKKELPSTFTCIGIEQSNIMLGIDSEIFFVDVKSRELRRVLKLNSIDEVHSVVGTKNGIAVTGKSSTQSGIIARRYDYLFHIRWELGHREDRSLLRNNHTQLKYCMNSDFCFLLLKESKLILTVNSEGLVVNKFDLQSLTSTNCFDVKFFEQGHWFVFCSELGSVEIHYTHFNIKGYPPPRRFPFGPPQNMLC